MSFLNVFLVRNQRYRIFLKNTKELQRDKLILDQLLLEKNYKTCNLKKFCFLGTRIRFTCCVLYSGTLLMCCIMSSKFPRDTCIIFSLRLCSRKACKAPVSFFSVFFDPKYQLLSEYLGSYGETYIFRLAFVVRLFALLLLK